MKIYNICKKIKGLGNDSFDYETVYNSGYSAGHKDGFDSYVCYKNEYLTIEAISDGTLMVTNNNGWDGYLRFNGGEWMHVPSGNSDFSLVAGDRVEVKGVAEDDSFNGYGRFRLQMESKVYGNILSMRDGDDFMKHANRAIKANNTFADSPGLTDAGNLILPGEYPDYQLMFTRCTALAVAPELPAVFLDPWCYSNMFFGCTSLTETPELPAKVLTNSCYAHMFQGCTGLTSSPELPATELADGCYQQMFYDCPSLTVAPELPATTLATNCYDKMFARCTRLSAAPELPATELAGNCYREMFNRCTSLTEAPELQATVLADGCYKAMFKECTGLVQAPDLLAVTLVPECYYEMFNGCTRLNYVKCKAANISATDCTTNWLKNVAMSGTFVTLITTNWSTGDSGIPLGWFAIPEDV